jgi:16S rRNA (guanine966-N2)-methyltransferase
MRIVGGAFNRHALKVPKKGVRPTKGIVREAVFSIIADTVVNAEALDIFAGSGVLGIEAISRGARHCIFIDKNTIALRVNIAALMIEEKAKVLAQDFRVALRLLKHRKFDLIFADPPYSTNLAQMAMDLIGRLEMLKHGGMMMIEHSPRQELKIPEDYSLYKTRKYGDTTVTFLKTQKTLKDH